MKILLAELMLNFSKKLCLIFALGLAKKNFLNFNKNFLNKFYYLDLLSDNLIIITYEEIWLFSMSFSIYLLTNMKWNRTRLEALMLLLYVHFYYQRCCLFAYKLCHALSFFGALCGETKLNLNNKARKIQLNDLKFQNSE